MKREILEIMNEKDGTLKINKICVLRKEVTFDKKDAVLWLEFHVNGGAVEKIVNINHKQDWKKVVENIVKEMEIFFDEQKEKYVKFLRNGYLG